MAIINVTTLADENDGSNAGSGISLRDAIIIANTNGDSDDTITFDPLIANQTITLALGDLVITSNMTIDGEDNDITVSGANTFRTFIINAGVTAVLDTLTIADGSGVFGGAIRNLGTLTVANSTVRDSLATEAGAGIHNFLGATLTVDSSLITNNTSGGVGVGGAINNQDSTATIMKRVIKSGGIMQQWECIS
jgi:hypothetical protein